MINYSPEEGPVVGKFIERPPQFEAVRFNYEAPEGIITWVRSKSSHAVVCFNFPKDLSDPEKSIEGIEQYLLINDRYPSTEEITVPQDYWLVYLWPIGRDQRKWSVLDDEQFNRFFKEGD